MKTEKCYEIAEELAEAIADHFDAIADEVGSDLLTYILNGGIGDGESDDVPSEDDVDFIIREAVEMWRDYV